MFCGSFSFFTGPSDAPPQGAKRVLDFWKAFHVKNAVDTLIASWADVSVAVVLHAWRPLLGDPQGDAADNMSASASAAAEVDRQVAEAVSIAHRIPGCDSVTAEEVLGMVQNQQQEPTVEEMVEEADEEEEEAATAGGQEVGEAADPKIITVPTLRRLLMEAEKLKDLFVDLDPEVDRSFNLVKNFNTLLEPYNALFKQHISHQQQALITRYFRRPTTPSPPREQELDEAEIDDVLAEFEDDDVVSNFDFGGFGTVEGHVSGSDSDSE